MDTIEKTLEVFELLGSLRVPGWLNSREYIDKPLRISSIHLENDSCYIMTRHYKRYEPGKDHLSSKINIKHGDIFAFYEGTTFLGSMFVEDISYNLVTSSNG